MLLKEYLSLALCVPTELFRKQVAFQTAVPPQHPYHSSVNIHPAALG